MVSKEATKENPAKKISQRINRVSKENNSDVPEDSVGIMKKARAELTGFGFYQPY